MKLRDNVFLISFALVIGQILTNTSPAHSVEFGQDATGDPNAVHIQGNSTGFLYSERIIFTAAHVLNQLRIQPNGDTDGFVYAPGLADKSNAKRYKIIKAFIPKTFISPTNNPPQPLDDVAIIVLNEDMPLKTKVVIATEQQMIRFAQEKVKVQMIGYGLQSGSQRSDPQEIKRAPYKLTSYLYSPQMMQSFYTVSSKPPLWRTTEWGAIHTQAIGSICNADSGSGFFVQENDIRYYVGTAGNGLGISNCQADGSVNMDPAGGMSWFPAPFKFLDLLNTAETFVAEEKQKELKKAEEERTAAELKAKQEADEKAGTELKAKQEADAKAAAELRAKQEAELKTQQETAAKAALAKKTTITCSKGKLTKKVTAVKPKCPSGYKVNK